MPFNIIMHSYNPGEKLGSAAFIPTFRGVFQTRRVDSMIEFSLGKLLAKAAFMHHDDLEQNASQH